MFLLKGCPRCRGDISLEEDGFGKYLKCMQCGFHWDLKVNPSFGYDMKERTQIESVSEREGSGRTPGHNPGHFSEEGYQKL